MSSISSRRPTSLPLDPVRHQTAGFDCGVGELSRWLIAHAETATRRGTARTWVWLDDADTVVGYYALSAHKVAVERIPGRLGRGGPSEIPAVLIGKLALDKSWRGRGLGEYLVGDALVRIASVSQTVGARLVVVDALSEPVARFYERLGFSRRPGSLLLTQRIAGAVAPEFPGS